MVRLGDIVLKILTLYVVRRPPPGCVFVIAAEFLNITEKTGMVNLTVRFPVMKSW